jgi:hypothetical protein
MLDGFVQWAPSNPPSLDHPSEFRFDPVAVLGQELQLRVADRGMPVVDTSFGGEMDMSASIHRLYTLSPNEP